MSALEMFIIDLQQRLLGYEIEQRHHNVIRIHSKKLKELGDLSFPLNIKNWYHLVDGSKNQNYNILDHFMPNSELHIQCNELKCYSKNWVTEIDMILVKQDDIHIHLTRSNRLFKEVFGSVLANKTRFGSSILFRSKVNISSLLNEDESSDLTQLRLSILENVANRLIEFTSSNYLDMSSKEVYISGNQLKDGREFVLCSSVLNDQGVKNRATADDLYKKRTSDMRMMAQHKYGVQVKGNTGWEKYFEKLGKACVTMELLSNKPQKPVKISLHDLQSANKGASFIFYNCARLATLLKEFEKKVASNVYPDRSNMSEIDFSLYLGEPEEWELFYVYIMQFPLVVKSSIKDIEKGFLNPQYIVTFLANLSSVFSIYYRRVRILRDPREHLIEVLHARIYLLECLQVVFHNALSLLGIEPVEKM